MNQEQTIKQKALRAILDHAVLFCNRPLTLTEYNLASVSLTQLETQIEWGLGWHPDDHWGTLSREHGLILDTTGMEKLWSLLRPVGN